MTAAARMLLHAIEDAVQQLEPQLLTLFGGGGSSTRERVERPTQRTHSALKRLVALTRFFPAEHRVCQAGRQLELIWPPLVHEPDGAAAGRLLKRYFRLRQDLLDPPVPALRHAMRGFVRGAIDAAQGGYDVAQVAACEQRLRQLAAFLPEWNGCMRPNALSHPGATHEATSTLSPLAKLCAWQQALDATADACATPGTLKSSLLHEVIAVLDRCTMLCRASNWTLEYLCNSGLARGLWHLRGIACFCGDSALARRCAELDDECLDMHLTGNRPSPALLQQWLARLLGVMHADATAPVPPHDDSGLPHPPFCDVYERELAAYCGQLQVELQLPEDAARPQTTGGITERRDGMPGHQGLAEPAPCKVSITLVTVLYKLTWVFAAAGWRDWSRLCHCAYRVTLQHWRIRQPVSAAVTCILEDIARLAGTRQTADELRPWRWQLLKDWPCWTDDAQRPIALRHDAGEVVTLDAVPDLLSGSFTTLVQAGRLAQPASAQHGVLHYQLLVQDLAAELVQELTLLEKGAAAMKVWPLEQLCTLLIAVYEKHLRDDVELPAALLQDAHRQLVCMLDQAAAWRDVQVPAPLVQELEAWLRKVAASRVQCREPGTSIAVPEQGDDDCGQMLRTHLLTYLGTLAPVLERPVRLHLEAGDLQLGTACMTQVLDCLRPLVKFMLLDQSIDTRMRHAMHKPRVSTLAVGLRATSATLVVNVSEDSHEEVLAPSELQRLQRRLPKAAGALVCESRAGHGRSFTFTLGEHASAEAR
ncbi:MAG TPA: hypothetical protein VGE69_12590 [Pseudomonadales bacterium]